jgi:hypothetical protein
VCAGADGETMNASVNSICMHSAGAAAPGESVGRGDNTGRQPASRQRAHMRETRHTEVQPPVRRRRSGASRALRDGDSGARMQRAGTSRGERLGEAAGERARGEQSADSRADPARARTADVASVIRPGQPRVHVLFGVCRRLPAFGVPFQQAISSIVDLLPTS